jgi:hypothetical protein
MIRKIILSFLTVIIFVITNSCTSIPKSNSNLDTLLIIPISFVKYTSPYLFGKYYIRFRSIANESIERIVAIDPTKDFLAIQGLPEGTYITMDVTFHYEDGGKTGRTYYHQILFNLYCSKMTILDMMFEYTQYFKDNLFYYNGWWKPLTKSKAEQLAKIILDSSNNNTWELSDETKNIFKENAIYY